MLKREKVRCNRGHEKWTQESEKTFGCKRKRTKTDPTCENILKKTKKPTGGTQQQEKDSDMTDVETNCDVRY